MYSSGSFFSRLATRCRPLIGCFAVAVLLVLITSAATLAAYPLTVKDDLGNTVTLTAAPKRIISLAPSNTEILFALGLGDKIVAVDSNSNYPAAVATKEKVGSGRKPSIERIVALQPDLVFLWDLSAKDLQSQLTRLNIPAVAFAPGTLAEIYECILYIGSITGTEQAAKVVVDGMKQKVNQVTTTVAKARTKPLVFFEVWPDPLTTAGPGSFVDQLITLAGGRHVAADTKSAWPVISVEHVVTSNPDVLLTPFIIDAASPGNSDTVSVVIGKNRSWFAQVNAVRNKRIIQVDQDLISRAGPRLADGLLLVAKAIHPELF